MTCPRPGEDSCLDQTPCDAPCPRPVSADDLTPPQRYALVVGLARLFVDATLPPVFATARSGASS